MEHKTGLSLGAVWGIAGSALNFYHGTYEAAPFGAYSLPEKILFPHAWSTAELATALFYIDERTTIGDVAGFFTWAILPIILGALIGYEVDKHLI